MPDFLKSEENIVNVGDVAIKKKAPSRTYIQMWVKLIEARKMHVSKSVYKQLKECSELLDEHLELVERIVRRRVEVTWKDSNLWILTRPMRDGETAEKYTFTEDSEFGIIEGTVYIIEHESK